MSSMEFWKQQCIQAFHNNLQSSNFIFYLESTKKLTLDGQHYYWKTAEYQDEFQQLGCDLQPDESVQLSVTVFATMYSIKSQIRSQWHQQRQLVLKQYLDKALQYTSPTCLNITTEQRLALIKQFMLDHEADVGSVPFIRGVIGLLKYQLQQEFLVQWELSEYVLTQNNEDAIDAYIRLLRGVLGLQLIETVKESVFIWRMTLDTDTYFIQQCLQCFQSNKS